MHEQDHTHSETSSEPRHIMLAREAIIKRIRRDEGYLAYRKALGRHTSYDELVTAQL